MIFNPSSLIRTKGSYRLGKDVSAVAHPCLSKAVLSEFWHNFTFQASNLCIADEINEFRFSVGEAEALSLDGTDYSINVTPAGISVFAENETNLIRGFMTLLDRIKATEVNDAVAAEIECCQIKDKPLIPQRMVHLCIFPETERWEVQRFLRACGVLKYTHVILEFWGMLKFDCLKELSWPHAFSKEQIRPILGEANDLGLEIIPAFNHWGHASASRSIHGKHVVLDQNPSLQPYFSENGWCWAIEKPRTKALLHKIREEMCDLCGAGQYFMLGCDEADGFEFSRENMDLLCRYLNEITEDLERSGRRPILWGDMFLFKKDGYNPQNHYCCNAPSWEAAQYMLDRLSRSIVIGDWQYTSPCAPVETALTFKQAGFDCLLCPWDCGKKELIAPLETIKAHHLSGFILTTWHTLSKGIPYVTMAARGGFEDIDAYTTPEARHHTAALMRKVMPARGRYERAGWSKQQIDFLWE
ncbi:MAG: family 20 glycosylhydrolase [Clostridia bacterium]|nr:family 20 glycosylhydrolase [Clostridia bacterium]